MPAYLFLLGVRWGLLGLGLVLLAVRGPAAARPLAIMLAVGVLYSLALHLAWITARRRAPWPVTALADIVLVSGLVWALGGIATDTYNLFYLLVAGVAILEGLRPTLAVAAAAAAAYTLAVFIRGPVPDTGTLLLRLGFLLTFGAMAGQLSRLVTRDRRETGEKDLLLTELRAAHGRLERYASEMARQAITDGLTGLYNQTYFHRRLEEEMHRAARHGQPVSLIVFDLDGFKDYNDEHGHLQGNLVLRQVAGILRLTVRSVDIVARYGGEEFAVILPGASLAAAMGVAERVRKRVEAAGFSRTAGRPLTLSAGVAAYPQRAGSRRELLELADQALYQSKRLGKNRVTSGRA